jgi:hypothetical protein
VVFLFFEMILCGQTWLGSSGKKFFKGPKFLEARKLLNRARELGL